MARVKEARPTLPFDSEEVRQLRQRVQKPLEREALEAWLFHRRFSIYITRQLLRFNVITPNAITATAILITSLSALTLWMLPAFEALWVAFIVYHVAYMLDVVDGEVARAKLRFSTKGLWLDRILAEAMNVEVALAVWRYAANINATWAIPVLLLSMLVRSSARCGFEQANDQNKGAPMAAIKRESMAMNVLSMASSPGGLLLWLALGAVTSWGNVFLTIGITLFVASTLYQVAYFWRELD